MCMGSKPTKVEVPKPAPLPPPLPAPPPPKAPAPPPKPLQVQGKVPDIRIGAAKSSTSNRARSNLQPGKSSLSIGTNQGLNV